MTSGCSPSCCGCRSKRTWTGSRSSPRRTGPGRWTRPWRSRCVTAGRLGRWKTTCRSDLRKVFQGVPISRRYERMQGRTCCDETSLLQWNTSNEMRDTAFDDEFYWNGDLGQEILAVALEQGWQCRDSEDNRDGIQGFGGRLGLIQFWSGGL